MASGPGATTGRSTVGPRVSRRANVDAERGGRLVTKLTLLELRAMPPSKRHKHTHGTIIIYFPEGTTKGNMRIEPLNPLTRYYWAIEYRQDPTPSQ